MDDLEIMVVCGCFDKHEHREVAEVGVCEQSKYWEQSARAKYMEQYGVHFNCNTAPFAVSKLVNMDKSKHHWTCEEVRDAIKPLGVVLTNANKWDACYLANMYYSDLCDKTKITDATILQMVAYKMGDVDAKEGDIYTEWEAKMMNHCVEIDYEKMI
ncbi:MAG: hypothetical protein R3Y39_08575 [Rikenellaceae bacterium]